MAPGVSELFRFVVGHPAGKFADELAPIFFDAEFFINGFHNDGCLGLSFFFGNFPDELFRLGRHS
jgi:hypothetical protein